MNTLQGCGVSHAIKLCLAALTVQQLVLPALHEPDAHLLVYSAKYVEAEPVDVKRPRNHAV